MAAFFISHANADLSAAERLRADLRAWGYASVFLDVHPDDGLAAGSAWERELYAQLRTADAVLFLGSAASVASHWCFAELTLARSRGTPVFPLWLGGERPSELLADTQWLDAAHGFASLRRVLADRFDARAALAWDPRRSPYPGLRPFEPEDAAVFFGREDKVAEVLRHLDPTVAHRRRVAVIGASGAGKSSLVRAGVLPRLGAWAVVGPITPRERPVAELARALAGALGDDRAVVQERLERDPRELLEYLRDVGGDRPVLLVVDQLEELVTLADPRERERFVAMLGGSVPVLATLRSEFLARSLREAAVDGLIDETVLLGPLDRARLPEVIAAPARKADIEFAPGLVERMADDTRGGDALPLLAYTLQQLHAGGAAADRLVTHEQYDAIGGVSGALVTRADAVAASLRDAPVIPTLLKFTTLDAEGEPTRRPLPLDRLGPGQRAVVDAFVDARLLAIDGDMIEVAHEALLRAWSPLRGAIDASREQLRAHVALTRLARDWDDAGREDGYLLHATRLRSLGDTLGEIPEGLEGEFYAASLALEARTRAHDQRRRRRTVVGLSAAVAVLALAAAVSLWLARQAFDAQAEAELQARHAVARQLTVQANALVGSDRTRSLLLAVAANQLEPSAQTRAALFSGLAVQPELVETYRARGRGIAAMQVDTDATHLLTVATDGTVVRRELAGGSATTTRTTAFEGGLAAISPNGKRVAVVVLQPRVQLWDIDRGVMLSEVGGAGDGAVSKLQFSGDGSVLATVSARGGTRLWSVRNRLDPLVVPPVLDEWLAHGAAVPSRDGRSVAILNRSRLKVVDVTTGRVTQSVPMADFIPGGFSPDGRHVWGALGDQTIAGVDVRRGVPRVLPDSAAGGRRFSFGTGDRLVVQSTRDRTRILDVRTGVELGSIPSTVTSAALDPRNPVLYAANVDGTVAKWRLAGAPGIAHRTHVDFAQVAFSGDGRYAAGSLDPDRSNLSVWPVENRAARRVIARGKGPGDWNVSAFDLHGRRLLAGFEPGNLSSFGSTQLYDAASGAVLASPPGEAIALSPDGGVVALLGDDVPMAVWHVKTKASRTLGFDSPDGTLLPSPTFSTAASLSAIVDTRLIRWDVGTGRATTLARDVSDGAVSPDGRFAVYRENSANAAWLYDLTRSTRRQLPAFDLVPLALSTRGQWLAALDRDRKQLVVSETRSGQDVAHLPMNLTSWGAMDGSAEFVPSRDILALHDQDALTLWDFSPATLIARACIATGRGLTPGEWRQYVGAEERYRQLCPRVK